MKLSVLKPGLLVSLKTSLRGGVNYHRVDIEGEHATDDGGRRAKWETTREIMDRAEYDAAVVARSAARASILAVCCQSSFGLLCPMARESELMAAVDQAQAVAETHNAGASLTRVEIYTLIGRIAQDDAEAARAIGAEVRELLEQMAAGIKAADPEVIREAANKARAIGGMLSAEVSGKVSAAILEARTAARAMVKRIEKSGETAAQVVSECSVVRIEAARFAFLDLDEQGGAIESEAPAARGLDLEAAPAYSAAPSSTPAPLELF